MSRSRERASSPRVLVLAGLEPTGRMGLLADVATLTQLGGSAIGIASAMTAQGRRTFLIEPVRPAVVAQQIEAALELGRVDAVKLGMIPNRRILAAARQALAGLDCPWVVDPVVRSSSGQVLSRLTRRDYWNLADARTVITPNLGELAWLTETPAHDPAPTLQALASSLQARGFRAVLAKGGHSAGEPLDVLCEGGEVTQLGGRRLARSAARHRGTGCRHASALAFELARGAPLIEATRAAKAWVERYLAR